MSAQMTAEEVAKLVSDFAALEAKLSEMEQANSEAEIEQRIAAAVEEAAAKVADLEAQLETKTAEVAAAVKQHDDLVAFLDAEKAAAEAAVELEAKKAERVEAAKALGYLPESMFERADHWAALSDEDWDARLAEWTELKPADAPANTPPADTSVGSGGIETASAAGGEGSFKDVLAGLRAAGVDAKRL